jgi:general secretion pathway protein G
MNTQTPVRTAFRNARRAFTLLEIMVVIAIIGLLVGVAVTGVQSALNKARKQTATIFVTTTLKTPLERYKIDCGSYPTTEEGLQALLVMPASAPAGWSGPYLDLTPATVMTLDPWQHPYQYAFPGPHNSVSTSTDPSGQVTTTTTTARNRYDVWSMGEDVADPNDDIGNW